MNYPGRVILKGEKDSNIVKAIQKKLNENGCGPIDEDGKFGPNTLNAVKLFQTRFSDKNGNPLIVDGKVGSITWEVLFGKNSVPINQTTSNVLIKNVLSLASSQVGIMEKPRGTNSGPEVNKYLKSVGLPPGNAWCAAYIYWCFENAKKAGEKNPLYKTGHVGTHWANSKGTKIKYADAINNPSLVKPGHIFIIVYASGSGHTGLVEKVNGGFITAVEGNTNEGGSREGIGVYRRQRKINTINKGFLQYW